MLNLIEETIIFLVDVSAPSAQAGKQGDVRTVGRNISNHAANWLLRGGAIRRIRKDQVQDVLIELGLAEPEPTKETEKARPELGGAKTERRTYGRKRADSTADQGSDNKSED